MLGAALHLVLVESK